MILSRRSLLKGFAATAGALLLPPTVQDNAEAVGSGNGAFDDVVDTYPRFWALGAMPGSEPEWHEITHGARWRYASFAEWVERYERYEKRDYAMLDWLPRPMGPYGYVTIVTGQSYNPYISGRA